MSHQEIKRIQHQFSSRLETLSHLLDVAEKHFGAEAESILERRLAEDMFPLGTQIAFSCNQPLGFALWCAGQPVENLNPEVKSFGRAREHIARTQALLADIKADDSKLSEIKRIGLGPELYAELPGYEYVQEFLIPNFYFHLSTAYAILRMAGVPLGKADYMRHMGPFVRRQEA